MQVGVIYKTTNKVNGKIYIGQLLNSEKAKAAVIRVNTGENLKKKQEFHRNQTKSWWQDPEYVKNVMSARAKSKRSAKSKERKQQTINLFNQGLKKAEISRILNVTPTMISYYLKG